MDADWQDAQARRQAFYTNLGPGDYRFSLMAANEDGVWSEPSPALTISIPAAFYQTRWFQALLVACGLALLWGAHRLRHRQLSTRLHARLEARMQERERIARELHDTLLQSTQGLILSVQAIAQLTPAGDPARDRIERVLQRADQAMLEGRERVRELREGLPADEHALPRALALVAEELAETDPLALHCTIEGLPRALRRPLPDEVYRIGREALVNAWKHARARQIDLQISYLDEGLVLRVRDDGIGFDAHAANLQGGHWGVVGMRERAARLGGVLTVSARQGGGTEVLLRVPAGQAYAHAPAASAWARLLSRHKQPRDPVAPP